MIVEYNEETVESLNDRVSMNTATLDALNNQVTTNKEDS